MKIKTPHFILAGLLATATVLPAATIIDGFGTLSVDNGLSIADIDGTWHGRDGTSYLATEAATTATTLTMVQNPYSATNRNNLDRAYDTAVSQFIDNTGGAYSGGEISLAFDYDTTLGTPGLFVHLIGLDITGASPAAAFRSTDRNGAASIENANNVTAYNLFTGSVGGAFGNAGDAYNGGVTGDGTVSSTIDLSGHATYQDLSDYDYIGVAIGWDFTAAGAIEVSNFSVTAVPEPSSAALLGGLLALSAVMLRRRVA